MSAYLEKLRLRFRETPKAGAQLTLGKPVEPVNVGVIIWHLVWSGFSLILLLGLLFLPATIWVSIALICGALPGVCAIFLIIRNDLKTRQIMIWIWALFSLLAVCLTGGTMGPMGAWVAAPLLAAVAFNQRVLISVGAALAFMSALIATFLSLSHQLYLPNETLSLILSIFSLFTMVIGLGTALMPALRARVERAEGAEEGRAKLLKLLTEQPNLILCLEADGKIISAYGEAPDGLHISDLMSHGLIKAAQLPDRQGLAQAIDLARTQGRSSHGFSPLSAIDHYWHIDLRLSEDGRIYAVLRDETLNRARMQAIDQQRLDAEHLNRTKSRFLANMSHELRTPLNAVIGFSDIMRQHMFGPLSEKYTEYSKLIWESGQHVLDLINDVLDMSKIEAEKYELSLEAFDLREIISSALSLIRVQAHEKNIDLTTSLPPHPLMVMADKRAIKQICLNLLSNAVKFTSKGGGIALSLLKDTQADNDCKDIEIIVCDTGIGIAPDDLHRLGKPFEQSGTSQQKALGTGLGLSLVRALTQLHAGKMSIESIQDKGTKVSILMPIAVGEAPLISALEATLDAKSDQMINPLEDHTLTPSNLSGFEDFIIRPPRS